MPQAVTTTSAFAVKGESSWKKRKKRGLLHECTGQIVFPEGARMIGKEVSVVLLNYLRDARVKQLPARSARLKPLVAISSPPFLSIC